MRVCRRNDIDDDDNDNDDDDDNNDDDDDDELMIMMMMMMLMTLNTYFFSLKEGLRKYTRTLWTISIIFLCQYFILRLALNHSLHIFPHLLCSVVLRDRTQHQPSKWLNVTPPPSPWTTSTER